MTPEILAVLIFVMVVALIVGPYYLFVVRGETATQDLLRTRIRTGGSGSAAMVQQAGTLLKEVEKLSSIDWLNSALEGSNAIAANLRMTIQRTGLKVSAGSIVLGSASLALFGFILMYRWSGRASVGLIGVVLGVIPYVVLRIIGSKRLNKF